MTVTVVWCVVVLAVPAGIIYSVDRMWQNARRRDRVRKNLRRYMNRIPPYDPRPW